MSLIVNASLTVKWFSEELGSDEAETLLAGREALIAPDLILAEIGNALWKKALKQLLQPRQAMSSIIRGPAYFDRLEPLAELGSRAIELAIELRHPIYDCFYFALAERERASIVSADKKLLAAAARLGTVEAKEP